jgi:flagellar motility protein MotE (MotC chaperone)
MATTDEIKGMIREVLEAIKSRLDEIDQDMSKLEAERAELQQLLPSWQSTRSEVIGVYNS